MRHFEYKTIAVPVKRADPETIAAKPTTVAAIMRRNKCLVVLICLGMFATFLVISYLVIISPEFNQYRILRNYQEQWDNAFEEENADPPRTILLWNSFFGDKRWSLSADKFGPNEFRYDFKCPEYRCELTNDRNFLPAIEMFDAVIFHTAEPFPFIQSVPGKRSPHQQYVFALMEPPGETKHILADEGGFYNLTMSYRLDSDVLWPYQFIEDIETGDVVAPAVHAKWRSPPMDWNDTSIWRSWEGNIRMASWFVSHCETLSKREKLAEALQQYIDVDIYGKCGNLSCPRYSDECDQLLDTRYKFYFSFENTLCNDYVTEKLYNAMQRNVIPVVFGGADYTRFVPPHSVIDAEQFENVEQLASYLRYVASHPAEYMQYFWWRGYYRLTYRQPFCDLCEKLHSVTFSQKTQSYLNIENWWMANQCRFESKIKF